MRVFLHDYSECFCKLVGLWLEPHPDLQLVAGADQRDNVLTQIAETLPDVVVLDAAIHRRMSLTPTEIHRVAPAIAIIVYSAHPPDIARRVAPGADAYVHKRGEAHELIGALRERCPRAVV